MYETAVGKGGNSAKSQGPEAETLRGRNETTIDLNKMANGIYYYIVHLGEDEVKNGKLTLID